MDNTQDVSVTSSQDLESQILSSGEQGVRLIQSGKYLEAIESFQVALTIAHQIHDIRNEATSLGNLGNVYARMKNNDLAIDYYEQALALFQQIGNRQAESTTLNNLGIIFSNMNNWFSAIDNYARAVEIAKSTGDSLGEAQALGNLGLAYKQTQQPDKAREYLEKARHIFASLSLDEDSKRIDSILATI